MRTETDVQDRIRYLLTQEINRRLTEATARLPHLCKHNYRHPLDVRKEIAGEPNHQYNRVNGRSLPTIGLCMLGSENPETWPGNICEDAIDAKRCPVFSAAASKESIQKEFYNQLRDLEWVSRDLPEVYGLLWALGSSTLPQLPWWKRLLFRFLQVRPDPLPSNPALTSGE
jgi:hypothetical protein